MNVKRWLLATMIVCQITLAGARAESPATQAAERRLPMKEYVDKLQAGWIGQMCGVGLGGPTEFKSLAAMFPESDVPHWRPDRVNQFGQDDIYVEMTFVRTLELHGFDVSIRQAGIDFANSSYRLWHANGAGRDNLRLGIAPPDSGHPQNNMHADDIDYQIEADFAGLISPGMPNLGIELGDKFGHLMNYGDGVYGGQFVSGMYAEAFFEKDPLKLIEAGLRCIPSRSQYHECISDVVKWHAENPEDFAATWKKIHEKYQQNPDYRRLSCSHGKYNIQAKINGAFIVMGLLYGKGDLEETMRSSIRCGQDSDCNPSNAAGVLFTTVGLSKLPAKFTSDLDRTRKFSTTPYTYPDLIAVCEKLARLAVVRSGGRIERDDAGEEVMLIPVVAAKPGPFEQSWGPGPTVGSQWTDEDRVQLAHVLNKPTNRPKTRPATLPETQPTE